MYICRGLYTFFQVKRFYSAFILLLMALAPLLASPKKKSQETQPSPMRAWFDTWHRNRLRYNVYNDSVFEHLERQEWVNLCIRRAAAYREMFRENQDCLDALHKHFSRPSAEIPKADYDSLFYLCEHDGKGVDVFMAYDLISILEQHFSTHHETPEELLNYLTALYYQTSFCFQFDRLQGSISLHDSYGYLSHLFSFLDDPAMLKYKDLQERMLFAWGLFARLSGSYVSAGVISRAEADSTINEIRKHLREPEWQWIQDFISGQLKDVVTPINDIHLTEGDRVMFARYYDFIQSYQGANTEKVAIEVVFKDRPLRLARAQWREGRISADQALQVIDSLRQIHGDTIPPLEELVNDGLGEALQEIIFLGEIIDSTSLSVEERSLKAREAYRYFYQVMLACQGRNDIRNNSVLEETVHDNALLSYLSRDERLNLLNKVMLTLQVNTYAHSTHLRKLVMTLLQGVIKHRPDLLVGMPGCGSVAEVQAKSDSLLDFIGQAALFHDLGKNSMGAIVTNDFRRLYDIEFDILKTHPERGLKYLSIDSTFQCYRDITLGHHLWYDGSKGYPMSFNNRELPVRPLIDIVTICDGLEAATDAVGRNYNPLKIFQTLMDEFDAGAGTRYNPDVIQVIHDDQELWHELEQQVTPQGCYSNYYDIYHQFFTE